MAKADRKAVVLYNVWRADGTEAEGDGKTYGALDERRAATLYASHCHRNVPGSHQWKWPVTFLVRNTTTNRHYRIVVHRETVFEFVTDGQVQEVSIP